MTAAVYVERARDWAKRLEEREAALTGQPLHLARRSAARKIAVPPGTFENLRRGRIKTVAAHVYGALRGGFIRLLEAELRHVEAELHLARQAGLDVRDGEVAALVASKARLTSALGLDNGGSA